MLQFREATIEDIDDITALFSDTITSVNTKDYSPQEIEAWAAGAEVKENWCRRLKDDYYVVAYQDSTLVGMACIDNDGYLDVIYVHKDYQGQGIASKLLSMMEDRAIRLGHDNITSDVSITAKPYFIHKGFRVIKPQLVLCRGVVLRNYNVAKQL